MMRGGKLTLLFLKITFIIERELKKSLYDLSSTIIFTWRGSLMKGQLTLPQIIVFLLRGRL
jgi:hypothetical protein